MLTEYSIQFIIGLLVVILAVLVGIITLIKSWYNAKLDQQYQEAINTELRERIEHYQYQVQKLPANKSFRTESDLLQRFPQGSPDYVPNATEYAQQSLVCNVSEGTPNLLIAPARVSTDEKDGDENRSAIANIQAVEIEVAPESQISIDLHFESEDPPNTYRQIKMRDLEDADLPDEAFLDHLKVKTTRRNFAGSSLERDSASERSEGNYSDDNLNNELILDDVNQLKLQLDIHLDTGYGWSQGSHFLYFRVIDHHGEDLATCEIINNGAAAVLQHPNIAGLQNGDTFAAHILVRDGEKAVQKVWIVDEVSLNRKPEPMGLLQDVGG